jgi:ABC-type microcin C transport system permease subunit YejB
MWAYIARRLLYAVPILLGVSMLVFTLIHLAPGDVVDQNIPSAVAVEGSGRVNRGSQFRDGVIARSICRPGGNASTRRAQHPGELQREEARRPRNPGSGPYRRQ